MDGFRGSGHKQLLSVFGNYPERSPFNLGEIMASTPSVRRALKRLVENPKASCRVRLNALANLQRLGAPVAMLERLMRDPTLPARLLSEVVIAYDAKTTVREWKRKQKKAGNPHVLGTLFE
jgi:hypothetical protein